MSLTCLMTYAESKGFKQTTQSCVQSSQSSLSTSDTYTTMTTQKYFSYTLSEAPLKNQAMTNIQLLL